MSELKINVNEKINKCLSCKHCNGNLSINEDDFWFSISCDKECPDRLDFDCLQCLMCDHFDECVAQKN